MTDKLVTKFMWHRTKDTEQFGDTKVSNTLYQAAVKCPFFPGPENKDIFKQVMLEILKSIKQRFRSKGKRAGDQSTSELKSGEMEDLSRKISEMIELIDSKQSSADETEDADDELF